MAEPTAPIPHATSAVLDRGPSPAEGTALTHGFYGRAGGVSTGLYASLNAGPGSNDDPGAVATNRACIASDIGAAGPNRLVSLYQIHSADSLILAAPPDDRPKGDAMVTRTPGLALCILTADCAPVLFADPVAGVIGAAHAGWKGALGGVLEACIGAMEAAGASAADISAAIGPCIHQPSYEVGPEFRGTFLSADPKTERFFQVGEGDRFHFDLPGYVAHRLHWSCGITRIDTIAHDTCALERQYFSNRRRNLAGAPDYGRNASVIMIQP
ncbi:MAG: peptidoglycan editing factor PgeF [Pseudomonadota bacterium]